MIVSGVGGPSPQHLESVIDKVLDTFEGGYNDSFDKYIAKQIEVAAARGQPVSCKKGCAFCCYLKVTVTQIDAWLIARHLRRTGQDTAELRRALSSAEATMEGRDADEYLSFNKPCVFLKDGACSVYKVRPLTCRKYMVISPAELCEDGENYKRRRIEQIDNRAMIDHHLQVSKDFYKFVGAGPFAGTLPRLVLWALNECDKAGIWLTDLGIK